MTHQSRRIGTVLATVPYGPEDLETLRQVFAHARFLHYRSDDWDNITEALQVADVAVLEGDIDDRILAGPKLRWVHCDHAGLNKTARPSVFDSGLVVTGSAGRSASALAQHAFYFALALALDGPGLLERQKQHIWRGLPGYADRVGLWGKTLGLVGYGHTAQEMAALGKAFGMRVLVYRRSVTPTPPEVDLLYCAERGETMDQVVREADVLMLACRLTDETYHLIDAKRLASMKRTGYVINLARGSVIDEDALVDALISGEIAGAGLDVFETEPLPPNARIWSAPNVLISPHVTPRLPDRTQRSIRMIAENARLFQAGKPMLNQLQASDLYTKGDLISSN